MAYLMIHNKGNGKVNDKTKELIKDGISILRDIKNRVCKGTECSICPFWNRDSKDWGHCDFIIMQSLKNYNNGLTEVEPLTEEKIKEVIDFHKEAQGLI